MTTPKTHPLSLGDNIFLIDGYDLGMPGRTGTYVIQADELTLVETGPSPSVPYILDGLNALDLNPADVRYIIVTHIHLDHAGGAGLLLRHCPNAKVVVHPRGARHLADPSRLEASARAVYGERFDQLFNPIVPVPEDRLLVKEDNDTLPIAPDRTLSFLDTPGHAKHHFSIYDPVSDGMFTGDAAGVRYHQTADDCHVTFYLPTTSPNQFDPDDMLAAIERFRKRRLKKIFFGHFGMTADVDPALDQVSEWIPRFVAAGKEALARGEGHSGISAQLKNLVRSALHEKNIPDDHPVYDIVNLDMDVCAMGIEHYLKKTAEQ